jgi:hypothetical protein
VQKPKGTVEATHPAFLVWCATEFLKVCNVSARPLSNRSQSNINQSNCKKGFNDWNINTRLVGLLLEPGEPGVTLNII